MGRIGPPSGPVDPRLATLHEAQRRGLPVAPELEAQLLEEEAARRGLLLYPTFQDFVGALNPTLLKFEHAPALVDVAERVVAGILTRVLVLLPPRYFKTEIFGRLLAPYYLLRHPGRTVALTSYAAHRAWEVSEAARNNYLRAYGTMGEDATARARWVTPSGGQLWAVGMGGAITGRGYHLGLVDDPIHPEQATSPTYQRRFQEWWPETWLSRQEPVPNQNGHVGQILVVMQRLGALDPIDFLMRREVGEKMETAPQYWHVVAMDEVRSGEPLGRWDGPQGLPPTCTLEPDTRPIGTVLAPSRFTPAQVKEMQQSAGPLVASAQRQQRPMSPTGDFWNSAWFNTYTDLPQKAINGGKDWDTAYTENERNSASAYVESYRAPPNPAGDSEFEIYIHNVEWRWVEFPDLVKWMKGLPGPHNVEAKATGKSVVQALKAYGIKALEVQVKGDKLARAAAVQPAVSNGRIWVRAQVIEKLLWGERQGLLRVTAEGLQDKDAEGLDLNDAFVQAVARHLGTWSKRRTVSV